MNPVLRQLCESRMPPMLAAGPLEQALGKVEGRPAGADRSVPAVSSTWPAPEPVYVPVRVIPLPAAGASCRMRRWRLRGCRRSSCSWCSGSKRAARNVDGAAVYGGEEDSVAVPLPVILSGAFVGKRAAARHSARAADVVSRSGLVVEGPELSAKLPAPDWSTSPLLIMSLGHQTHPA